MESPGEDMRFDFMTFAALLVPESSAALDGAAKHNSGCCEDGNFLHSIRFCITLFAVYSVLYYGLIDIILY